MQNQLVFQEKNEIRRLRVQNNLLSCYEAPILAQIFSGRQELSVLDIGCNDGMKTVERFSSNAVSRVIGLEYNAELAKKAQKQYGNERFSFYSLDVESQDFKERLCSLMNEKQIVGFDVIYLSFVLMHLTDVNKLLLTLRSFLKTDGILLVIEANDSTSILKAPQNGLLDEFLEILKKDKYSGNRDLGASICHNLSVCGYDSIRVWCDAISAGEGERDKKKAIFTTFFSYLPEDIVLLLEAEPENVEYQEWSAWIDRNYKALKQMILREQTVISMGMMILSCKKGKL